MEIKYKDDPETKELVFQKVVNYFVDHQCFFGESVFQNDEVQLDAPEFLSELADEYLKFEVLSIDDND